MKVLYIINGLGFSNNTGIGGSDKRAVEMARNLQRYHPDDSIDILTTKTGHDLFFNKEKLDTEYYVIKQPAWWPNFLKNLLIGRVLSYIYTFFSSLFKAGKVKNYNIYFATSDFYFDIVPGYRYKKRHGEKLLCMVHHYIKDPLSRGGSLFINIMMYLSQQFGFWLILNMADAVFFYDTDEGRKIADRFFKSKKRDLPVYYVKNGINDSFIDEVGPQEKLFEACFLGGIRYSKGIRDFVPIWQKVVSKFPQAKFLIIGGGSEEIVRKLKGQVAKADLNENIMFTGPLTGHELYTKVKQSKLFLFPSHEEGWGIALCEAMYCGLPVICYNLPAFKTFGDVLDKFEVGDYEALADKVVEYLGEPTMIERKKDDLIATAKKYSWSNIAEEDHKMYQEIITS